MKIDVRNHWETDELKIGDEVYYRYGCEVNGIVLKLDETNQSVYFGRKYVINEVEQYQFHHKVKDLKKNNDDVMLEFTQGGNPYKKLGLGRFRPGLNLIGELPNMKIPVYFNNMEATDKNKFEILRKDNKPIAVIVENYDTDLLSLEEVIMIKLYA
jgi:hypothetical protein